MKPTLKRRFIEWICKVFGHRGEFSIIYASNRLYICKRCGAIISEPLSWQEMLVLEQIKQLEEKEEKRE